MAVTPVTKTIEQVIADSATKSKERNTGELGKDEFLNLLLTQLKYQDPMNPMEDKEFIGQMAQFTSLEQMQNMNQSMSTTRATSYLGKNIKADFLDKTTMETKHVDGVVSDVEIVNGEVVVLVNGVQVPVEKIAQISEVAQATEETNSQESQDISKYTGFIGFNVKGKITDDNKNEVSVVGRVTEVAKDDNGAVAYLDNVKTDIISFAGQSSLKTMEDKTNYLKSQVGKEIMVVVNTGVGKYVELTGTLKDFTADDKSVKTVTLDNLKVPVDSISSVMEV